MMTSICFAALLYLVSTPLVAADGAAEAGQAALKEIDITAERFQFTPRNIQVDRGDLVRLTLRSLDVPHGFGLTIGEFEVNRDLEPEKRVTVEFVATESGNFRFRCTVVCGDRHDGMNGKITVVDPGGPPTSASPGQSTQPETGRDPLADFVINPAEPDFTLLTLPTTLRLPARKFAFRLTHRLSRPLDGGPTYENLLEDFFGFDSPAAMGLELRFGLAPGTQIGIQRGNNKALQIFGRQSILAERDGHMVGLDAMISVDGRNNFREAYSPVVAVVVSKLVREHAAFYVEPTWVSNTNKPGAFHVRIPASVTDDATFMVGLGTRFRVRPTVYVAAEYVPRVGGLDIGRDLVTFAVEKRVGGHVFQLNFSNSLGVTPIQAAQGAHEDDWFIGFNITRKFY